MVAGLEALVTGSTILGTPVMFSVLPP